MFGRYRKTLRELLFEARHVSIGLDQYDNARLLAVQLRIVRVICLVEKRLNLVSHTLGSQKGRLHSARLPKTEAGALKQTIAALESKRTKYLDILYYLRAIGDSIAYTFFNEFDLKPLAFKESAGQLRDKKGRGREIASLKGILRRDVPALLCDITNVLRYGDICVNRFGIPSFIEVKSSQNRNARFDRQIAKLQKMANYLRTDKTDELYGIAGPFRRVAAHSTPIRHVSALKDMIDESLRSGYASREPERGLVYAAFRRFNAKWFQKVLERLSHPQMAVLNEYKFTGHWASYIPYTLAFHDYEHCLQFASGDFVLAVGYDTAVAGEIARAHGHSLSTAMPVDLPHDWIPKHADSVAWWLTPTVPRADQLQQLAVSQHMVGRVFFEFTSLSWLVQESCKSLAPETVDSLHAENPDSSSQ